LQADAGNEERESDSANANANAGSCIKLKFIFKLHLTAADPGILIFLDLNKTNLDFPLPHRVPF